MCGICGIVDFGKQLRLPDAIQGMTDLIIHRGPDGQGTRICEPASEGLPAVALGHRRLSVIDLSSAGRQPMAGSGDSTLLVYNGEIYNYREKRAECPEYPFRSQTDSEVILALYERFEDRFIEHLDGMFALAIWDTRRQRLLLARDRSGKKPLFYYAGRDFFAFGSEIKSLLSLRELTVTTNERALPLYLTFGYVPTPETFFTEIQKLEPGTLLSLDSQKKIQIGRFWQYPVPSRHSVIPTRAVPEQEAALRDLITRAVDCRMISDVPLGAFLSGGIDSSIIVASMSRLSKEPIRTFSIGFEGDAAYDETRFARLVAKSYGTQHTEFRVRPDAVDLLKKLVWHYDEPFGDSSAIPTYLVSKLARDHVTVALSGDGGDELFAGYERFAAAIWADRIPQWILEAGKISSRLIPARAHAKSTLRRVKRFFEKSTLAFSERYLEWNSFFTRSELAEMLSAPLQVDVAESFCRILAGSKNGTALQRILHLNFATYLLDDLLVKTDRTSMAHGLEVRCPFLDTRLIEWAAMLPDNLKIRHGTLKYLLKRAYRDELPKEILNRPKMGFGVPLGYWMRHDLKDFSFDMLLGPSARNRGLLKTAFVQNLLEEHLSHAQDHGQRIWSLLCLEMWLRTASELPSTSSASRTTRQ